MPACGTVEWLLRRRCRTGGARPRNRTAITHPQLEPYIARLQPALEAKREGVRQYEATRVYGAIMQAAGAAMYDKLMEVAADGLPYHLFLAPR